MPRAWADSKDKGERRKENNLKKKKKRNLAARIRVLGFHYYVNYMVPRGQWVLTGQWRYEGCLWWIQLQRLRKVRMIITSLKKSKRHYYTGPPTTYAYVDTHLR